MVSMTGELVQMRTSIILCLSILFFLFSCLCPPTMLAGEVRGYVTDQFGEGIAGALVSGPDASGTTSDTGLFSFNHPAGFYSFTASAEGYQKATRNNVEVPASGTTDPFYFILSPMSVDSVYPSLGELKKDLDIFIGGAAFDNNTRLALMPDSGNLQNMVGPPYDTEKAKLVDLDGTTAYVVDSDYGDLYIIDVTNPTDPSLLGTFSFSGYARDLVVLGSHVYIVYGDEDTGEGGFYVINVGDPSVPFIEGSLPLGDLDVAYGIALNRNIAYVVDGASGSGNLHAVDVSVPSDPTIVWSLDAPLPDRAEDIKLEGSLAYIANMDEGLKIVDIDPASAAFRQVLNPEGTSGITALSVETEGTHAFVGTYWNGLQVYDVSDPTSPILVGQADTTYEVRNIKVVDNVAYAAEGEGGLSIFDVRNPDDPMKLGTVFTEESVFDVVVLDKLAYIANSDAGLTVFNVRNPEPPLLIGSLPTSSAYELLLEGDTLYLAESRGFRSIDVSNPSSLKTNYLIGNIGMILGMAKANTTMYLAANVDDNSPIDLQIIDLDNTENVTTLDLGTTTSLSVAVNEDYIFVGHGDCKQYTTHGGSEGGLILIDLDDNATRYPIPLGGCVYDVVVRDKVAYVTVMDNNGDGADNGLKIIDVNPVHEATDFTDVVIGALALDTNGSPHGLAVEGNYAFVADTWQGIKIIDISTNLLPNPALVGETGRLGSIVWDIEMIGNTAYVADYSAGIYMIDVLDKTNPVVVGWVDTPGQALDVTVDGDIAHVADSRAGLTIVPLPFEFTGGIRDVQASLISAQLSSPKISGHYIIRAFHDTVNIGGTLAGAVSFTGNINLLTSKAIIVAGGGPEASGDIWAETKAYANYAYDNLIYQGYKHEDIYYLTDEPDPLARYGSLADYANLGAATKANLYSAITQWAKSDPETSGLLLFFVDHGRSEEFQIRGGSNQQYVSAAELDSWLDTLQKSMTGQVVFIYDACKSGSFISKTASAASTYLKSTAAPQAGYLSDENTIPKDNPPVHISEPFETMRGTDQTNGSGKHALPAILFLLEASSGDPKRVIITSSGSDQVAYFLNPSHSFSYHFWSTLSGKTGNEANLSEALAEASSIMSEYQEPQLDANGNGIANESDDYSALQELEGTIYALRRQFQSDLTKPVIGESAVVGSQLTASNVYDVDGDEIISVWVEITRPDYNPHQNLTVTDIPTVLLNDLDKDGVYEGSYPDFDVEGNYILNFYAKDSHNIISQPKTLVVNR